MTNMRSTISRLCLAAMVFFAAPNIAKASGTPSLTEFIILFPYLAISSIFQSAKKALLLTSPCSKKRDPIVPSLPLPNSAINTKYWYSGDPKYKPLLVYDDGIMTTILMPPHPIDIDEQSYGSVEKRSQNYNNQVEQFHYFWTQNEEKNLIFSGLSDRFVIILQHEVGCIFNKE